MSYTAAFMVGLAGNQSVERDFGVSEKLVRGTGGARGYDLHAGKV